MTRRPVLTEFTLPVGYMAWQGRKGSIESVT